MNNAQIATLPNGTAGFDTADPLTAALIAQYRAKGYGFVVRYIGRNDGSKRFVDLTAAEAQLIVDSGLALCVVQHPLDDGWSPDLAKGQEFGTAAASLAQAAGLLPGTSVWLDLEGVLAGTAPQDVIDYCDIWHDLVAAAGFVPGIYIGANPGLSADQLYWDLKMKSYWQGGSDESAGVPADIPNRGYQMTQRITGAGATELDQDVAKADHFGGAVQWCVKL